MDLVVLNTDLIEQIVCDQYQSFLWTDRYGEYGDFELIVPASQTNINNFKDGWYLEIGKTERKMIIEEILLMTSYNGRPVMSIKGRSPESILDRRIIAKQTNIDGSLQLGIKKLIDDNIINPPYSGTGTSPRKIPKFVFEINNDPRVVNLKIQIQITYATLYDAIKEMCSTADLGFSLRLTDDGVMTFRLYLGEDRSYDQDKNQYVVFSPNNDNMINSQYLETSKMEKTHITVGGEGEGTDRVLMEIDRDKTKVGLRRKEMFVDARDLSSNKGSEDEIPLADYKKLLIDRGNAIANDYVPIKSFEGEADTTFMYIYNQDFFIGDIVQIENEFGKTARTRVTEILFSADEEGILTVPTFTIV